MHSEGFTSQYSMHALYIPHCFFHLLSAEVHSVPTPLSAPVVGQGLLDGCGDGRTAITGTFDTLGTGVFCVLGFDEPCQVSAVTIEKLLRPIFSPFPSFD